MSERPHNVELERALRREAASCAAVRALGLELVRSRRTLQLTPTCLDLAVAASLAEEGFNRIAAVLAARVALAGLLLRQEHQLSQKEKDVVLDVLIRDDARRRWAIHPSRGSRSALIQTLHGRLDLPPQPAELALVADDLRAMGEWMSELDRERDELLDRALHQLGNEAIDEALAVSRKEAWYMLDMALARHRASGKAFSRALAAFEAALSTDRAEAPGEPLACAALAAVFGHGTDAMHAHAFSLWALQVGAGLARRVQPVSGRSQALERQLAERHNGWLSLVAEFSALEHRLRRGAPEAPADAEAVQAASELAESLQRCRAEAGQFAALYREVLLEPASG